MAETAKQELKENILAKFKGPVLASLATITEEGTPWVRYVTPPRMDDDSLSIAALPAPLGPATVDSRKSSAIQDRPQLSPRSRCGRLAAALAHPSRL